MKYPTLEEINVALARKSHEEFIRYCWVREFDPFVVGRHTRVTCERFDRALDDFRIGKSTYLCVQWPHGHGKSDITSRYFTAKFIGEFPDMPVIVTGYSSGLTEGFSGDCQAIVRSDAFRNLYPGVEISKRKGSLEEWHIEGRQGKLCWPGLTGSITGKRAALGICDDFFSGREEAESETVRDARWNALVSDFLTRAYPRCIVVILATPWHVDDIFGRIKRKMAESDRFPRFEFMTFPAFSSEYETGTLFPERYSDEWYEAQKAFLGPYGTASLLQCNPVAEFGNMFDISKVKYYDEPPVDVRWSRGWDLALTEKQTKKQDPDYTASVKLGIRWVPTMPGLPPKPVLYIDDYTCWRKNVFDRDKEIVRIAMEDGPVEIGVESYGTQRESYDRLSAILNGIRKVTRANPPKGLVARADSLRAPFDSGNVWMRRAPWNDEFLRYIGEFPSGKHDDPVAALITAFEVHKPFTKHVWPEMVDVKSIGFALNWGKRQQGDPSSLHYGAVVQDRDLSIWVVCALWDDISGQLFVYDCACTQEPNVGSVVAWLYQHMRMDKHVVDRIVCNDRMVKSKSGDGAEKTMQKLFRDEFKRLSVAARLNEAMRYDQWGAISQVNKVLAQRSLFVEDRCEEALLQWQQWTVEKGRPVHENTGYCECLCLIISELKKKNVFRERLVRSDYVSEDRMKKMIMDDPINQKFGGT